MDLQQEYFTRHGFDLETICYPDNREGNSIVLMNKDARRLKQPRFILVSIQLNKQESHPSFYKFIQSVPSHDSFMTGSSQFKAIWDKKVYYDEWDEFMRRWSCSNKGELIPLANEEFVLATTEMFLYSHDSWLAQNLTEHQKDRLLVILDENLPMNERMTAVGELEERIRTKSMNVYSGLMSFRVHGKGKLYAGWVEKLL